MSRAASKCCRLEVSVSCIGSTVDGSVEHRGGIKWTVMAMFNKPTFSCLQNAMSSCHSPAAMHAAAAKRVNYPEPKPLIPYGNYVTAYDERRPHQLSGSFLRRPQFSTYHGIRRSPAWDGNQFPWQPTPPSPPFHPAGPWMRGNSWANCVPTWLHYRTVLDVQLAISWDLSDVLEPSNVPGEEQEKHPRNSANIARRWQHGTHPRRRRWRC
jgi:hypothetical protein